MTQAPELPIPLSDLVGPVIRDLARHSGKDLNRWLRQVDRLRGCADPVRLIGDVSTLHHLTGEVLHQYSTTTEPHGHLLVRCGNRRASRCPACAETYRADTFHLIRSGLLGGDKGVPDFIRAHPRVLATLTAPSFGPVHRGPDKQGQATSGTLDRRVKQHDLARLDQHGVTEHAARLIRTAWDLGNLDAHPRLAPLRLRQWAHMLGFRGHFSTKSRTYSTTLTALRRARLEFREARDAERQPYDPNTTLVLAHWRYAGQGYTTGESALAASISNREGT